MLEHLAPHEVHVWLAEPASFADPAQLRALDALVSPDERTRTRAFAFEENRRESLVTRGLVRASLSRYRSMHPRGWRFRRNAYGRPELDPPCGLRFNLSNCPELVVCAVCEDAEIGIDVEPMRHAPRILGLADTVFAPAELAELRRLPPDRQIDRAVSLWTLKEAYIKARGIGLSLSLRSFAMSLSAGAPPRVTFGATIDDEPSRWAFRTIEAGGLRIALAVETHGAEPVVRLRRWRGRPSVRSAGWRRLADHVERDVLSARQPSPRSLEDLARCAVDGEDAAPAVPRLDDASLGHEPALHDRDVCSLVDDDAKRSPAGSRHDS